MADGPLDYGSGGFFESQKGISDRRAARGFPPGPSDGGRGSGSTRADAGSGGGGGGLVATLLFGLLFILWKIAEVAIPIVLWLMWEAAKLIGQMLMTVMSGGKRR